MWAAAEVSGAGSGIFLLGWKRGVKQEDWWVGFIMLSLPTPGTFGIAWEGKLCGSGLGSEWNHILSIFFFYKDNDNHNNNHLQETKLLIPLTPKPYFRVTPWEEVSKATQVLLFGGGKNVPFLKKIIIVFFLVSKDFTWRFLFSSISLSPCHLYFESCLTQQRYLPGRRRVQRAFFP